MPRLLIGVKIAVLLAACYALIQAGILLRQWSIVARDASALITDTRGALAELRTQSQEQLARLRDPRNSKAIDAGLQTLAVYNATGRLINTQVIPRAMRTLDGLADSTAALNRMISATDKSINAGLLPDTQAALRQTTATIQQAENSLRTASEKANAGLDAMAALLSDPALQATAREIQAITTSLAGTAQQIEESSRRMPAIADSIEKIAATSSRYRKAILLSQILSAVTRAFF